MSLLGFIGTLVFLAGLWHLRRTDFGKAMFVLIGICVLGVSVLLIAYH